MLKLNNIGVKFGQNVVFDNFNLSFESGKTTVIMGRSGVGKTTLLNVLASTVKFSGSVEVEKPISYIFQTPRLLENLTVEQNLIYVLKNAVTNLNDYSEKIQKLLSDAGISEKKNALASTLSGGQKQRVSMLRAFLYPSKLLLMDEPFTSLDIAIKARLIDLYKHLLLENPRTVVCVSHDLDEALLIADRIIVLGENKILLDLNLDHCDSARDLTNESCVLARSKIYSALVDENG